MYSVEFIGLDLISPYPISNHERYRYAFNIVHYFRKWLEFVPIRKASAKGVVDAIFDKFVSKYNSPVKLIIDYGPCFVSDIFNAMCAKMEI